MTRPLNRLGKLLAELGIEPASTVAYGALAGTADDSGQDGCGQGLPRADDLPPALKVDVAVVDARGSDDIHGVGALLARLRDVHAQRVVVLVDRIGRNELLALRFEPTKRVFEGGQVFLSSAAVTDKRREWNNARNWAHPENFDRFRW